MLLNADMLSAKKTRGKGKAIPYSGYYYLKLCIKMDISMQNQNKKVI